METNSIIHGDCVEKLNGIADDHVDVIIIKSLELQTKELLTDVTHQRFVVLETQRG